ncbi:hypothetical protein LOTGIDRAFT_103463, partial [Lottia gigantea]
CDSGFGHALAKKLDSIGMRVYAGCLIKDGPGAIELRNNCSERLVKLNCKLILLSWKNVSIISHCIVFSFIHSFIPGLWGLVNNAGVWYCSELEMTSEKILHRVMDVNLFGAVRITKACLPMIRASKGRIINVSSLLGIFP